MYQLPLTDGNERISVSTKCPNCKVPTQQEAVVVTPVGEGDPLELLKLSKRLVVCTKCGNLRLIN